MSHPVIVHELRLTDFHLTLGVPPDTDRLSEEDKDKLAAKLQAAMDKLLLEAIYGYAR